jgi:2-keto-4-pentenoate hydratase/2-oxohepta-3-ene-1,7-dioic acid hydratase in catechol pathway
MRFISYQTNDGEGVGLKTDRGYRGLSVADLGGDLRSFLHDDNALSDLAKKLQHAPEFQLSDITLLPPIPRPNKMLCIGLNYSDHAEESGFDVPQYPTVFSRFAQSMVAAGEPLVCPNASTMFDYECELVAVIGRGGRHIVEEQALDHVAGYSIFNDGSIRDYQMKSQQWTMGKTFDKSGSFGPELVTRDELPAGCEGLQIRTVLNGEVLQDSNTKHLIFNIAKLVSTLSVAMTLEPGDLIISGTPGGVGALRKPPVWLKAGDECTIEIEQIGSLTNPVMQEGQA